MAGTALSSASTLGYSESQKLVAGTFRTYLEGASPPAAARRYLEEPGHLDHAVWAQIAAQGWLAAGYDESLGGQGLAFDELAAIVREAGRALLHGPFFTNAALLPQLLAGLPLDDGTRTTVREAAAGETIATFAILERPLAFPVTPCATLLDGGTVSGRKEFVPDLSHAGTAFVLAADAGGERVLARVDLRGAGAVAVAHETLDGSNAGTLTLDGVPVRDAVPFPEPLLRAFMMRGALAVTALQVGGAEAAIDITSAYANERVQFGRVIAAFQAVSHRLADMYCSLAVGRSLHDRAVRSALLGAPGWRAEAAMAKAWNNDMSRFVANSALQLHGGVGYTWDHDVHLFVRAAQALAGQFGTSRHHRVLLKEHWGAGGGDAPDGGS